MQKINKLALALSLGAVFGVVILIIALWHSISMAGGGSFGKEFMDVFQSIHPSSFQHQQPIPYILVNTAYGFMDGFILGFVTALLYNVFYRTGAPTKEAETSAADTSADA